MRPLLVLAAALLLLPCAGFPQKSAPPPAAGPSALDKPTLEAYVRHIYAWGPQITLKVSDPKPSALPGFKEVVVLATAGQASQEETFLVSNDGKKIIRGTVYDIAVNPFQAEVDKVKTSSQPSLGTPGAPVSVVIYSDFQCSFCKEEAKLIRQNLPGSYQSEVAVYFKDFPLESLHPWAKQAAVAGRCVFRQNPPAFWAFHDWIFEKQAELTPENLREKVVEFARTKEIEPVQFASCIDTKATEADVDRSVAEGKSLAVNSTPTMFVNGRRVVGQVPWPQLKQIIDHEIEYSKAHGGGDKCCEVTLPTSVKQ